ncbi:MAG: small multidrug export protein, partial [Clostridiales bacterium]|nr:small multidrug export protein [Clostridiales bacterium]
RMKRALPSIVLGVDIAGIAVAVLTYGVGHLLG